MRPGCLLGMTGAWRGIAGPSGRVVAAQRLVTSAVVAVRVDTGVELVSNVGVVRTSVGAAGGDVSRPAGGHAARRAVGTGVAGDAGIGIVGHIGAMRADVGSARGASVAVRRTSSTSGRAASASGSGSVICQPGQYQTCDLNKKAAYHGHCPHGGPAY